MPVLQRVLTSGCTAETDTGNLSATGHIHDHLTSPGIPTHR